MGRTVGRREEEEEEEGGCVCVGDTGDEVVLSSVGGSTSSGDAQRISEFLRKFCGH